MVGKETLIFVFPGYEEFAAKLQEHALCDVVPVVVSYFPDREALVTIDVDVQDKDVAVVCGLENATNKILPLLFFSDLVKELGVKRVGLLAPYLGYMRQDKRFKPGQAITSKSFAKVLSGMFDWLATVDPHLHRYKSLDEIYTIQTTVLKAAPLVGAWIKEHVEKPLLIGPDEESLQWVESVGKHVDAPFLVLKKIRRGDDDVEVSAPDIEKYKDHTPILVDDIISTANTMIETVKHVVAAGMKPPVCIGIHGIFVGDAYENLLEAGVARVVTTNSIAHETNEIDVTTLFVN